MQPKGEVHDEPNRTNPTEAAGEADQTVLKLAGVYK